MFPYDKIPFEIGGFKMDLKSYFENREGKGILATSDDTGRVDLALFSRPHVMDPETVAFIMADRLTHHNLTLNPGAAYMFMEKGESYKGVRLFLTKFREEQDTDLLYSLRSKKYSSEKEEGKTRFLVFFKVEKILPLIGEGEDE
jgi:hypothetical protein